MGRTRCVRVSFMYDVMQNSVGYDGPLPADWLYWKDVGLWSPFPEKRRVWLTLTEHTYEEAQALYQRWVAEVGKENLVVVIADLGRILIDEPATKKHWLGLVLMGAIRAESSLDSFDPDRDDPLPWIGVPSPA